MEYEDKELAVRDLVSYSRASNPLFSLSSGCNRIPTNYICTLHITEWKHTSQECWESCSGHCWDGQWVWSLGSAHSASTGKWLVGMPTGGRTFLIGLKLRGDVPGEWAGERTGRRVGPGRGCGRGCASGEGLRGYLRGADQMGRSVLLEEGGRTGA